MQTSLSQSQKVHIPGVGPMLVSLRANLGVPAALLAQKLGTTADEILREEAEDYPNLTVSRAREILAALQGFCMR